MVVGLTGTNAAYPAVTAATAARDATIRPVITRRVFIVIVHRAYARSQGGSKPAAPRTLSAAGVSLIAREGLLDRELTRLAEEATYADTIDDADGGGARAG